MFFASLIMLAFCVSGYAGPASGTLIGKYKFSAGSYQYNDNVSYNGKSYTGLEPYFPQEFEFEIVSTGGSLKVNDFFSGSFVNNTDDISAEYNQSTGILTLQAVSLQPVFGVYVGIAPNGEWGGITATTMKKMEIQISNNGTISIPDFEIIAYYGSTKGSVIVNYGSITVTKSTGGGGGGGDTGEIVAPKSIEGLWNFTLDDHYLGSESIDVFEGVYETTLDGNTVTFMETGDSNNYGVYHIVGTFINPTTIKVTKVAVGSLNATNPLYQVPYIFDTRVNTLNAIAQDVVDEFTITYNEEAGTLTFPQNSGLLYGNLNAVTGQLVNTWLTAFDFVSASYISYFPPQITITKPTFTAGPNNSVNVTTHVETQHFEGYEIASWKAQVVQYFSDNNTETDWDVTTLYDATVTNGTATFTITGLQNGRNDLSIYLVAYDAAGQQIAISNRWDITPELGYFLELSNPTANVDYDKDIVAVTFDVNVFNQSGITPASYQAVFVPDGDTPSDMMTVVASLQSNGSKMIGTANLTGLWQGSYSYYLVLNALDKDGGVLGSSNTAYVTFRLNRDLGIAPDPMAPATYETVYGTNEYIPSMGAVTVTWGLEPITLNEDAKVTCTFNGEDVYNVSVAVVNANPGDDPGVAMSRRRAASEDENGIVLMVDVDPFENPMFGFEPGDYAFSLPEGLVVNNEGQPNPAQIIIFTVLPTSEIMPTITPETDPYGWPAAEVETLKTITISWDNNPIELLDGAEIRFMDPEFMEYYITPAIANNTMTFNVQEYVTKNGNYELIIPDGCILINEGGQKTFNGVFDLSYKVTAAMSAVEEIEAGNGSNDVYSVDGMKLKVENIKDLAPGVYIINGKKVMIKR